MILFDGRKEAEDLQEKLIHAVNFGNQIPRLAIVQIGENASSQKYIQLKLKLCEKLGIPAQLYSINADLSDEDILVKVKDIFNDLGITGGIIQLPLPRKSLEGVLELLPVEKDLDLMCPSSQEKYYSGDFSRLPPVVRAVQHFIKVNDIDIQNMKITILGNGFLVGRPVSWYLKSNGSEVSVIEDYVKGKKLDCQFAILSAGIGGLVDGLDMPKGCHVIDYGSTVIGGKSIGDLDMESSINHLGIVSPSPGGMGPLVVQYLLFNLLGL